MIIIDVKSINSNIVSIIISRERCEPAFRCVSPYCASTFHGYNDYIGHIRTQHRDLYIGMKPQHTTNSRVLQERAAMQGGDSFDYRDDYNIDDNYDFETMDEGNHICGSDQVEEEVNEEMGEEMNNDDQQETDDQRRLRIHAEGLFASGHVKRLERMTADFARNIKKKANVSNKAADLLASNWCNHMVSVVDELYGLTDEQRNELNLIIKGTSTNRHRQLCRLPIHYSSIQLEQAVRPYIYISFLDTLRELFKQPEIKDLIHQDYLSKNALNKSL